jgi:hypothetical protein
VFVTRYGHDTEKDEALRLGACDVLEQPLTPGLLLAAVHNAMISDDARKSGPARSEPELHSVTRWADVVVRAVCAPRDLRTLREWGREVGVSVGGLRNWCGTARLPARRSLNFVRLLRAVVQRKTTIASPEDLLNVVDRRTLAKLLMMAGGTARELPADVHEFLRRQTFISDVSAVRAVQAALVSVPEFCVRSTVDEVLLRQGPASPAVGSVVGRVSHREGVSSTNYLEESSARSPSNTDRLLIALPRPAVSPARDKPQTKPD